MKAIYSLFFIMVLFVLPFQLQSQELSKEDYKRAVSFMYNNYNNKTAFNLSSKVNWFKDSSGIWFVDYNKDGETYKTVLFKNNKVEVLFDHKKLAVELNKIIKEKVTENNLSLKNIEKENGNITFKVNEELFSYNIKKNILEVLDKEKKKKLNKYEIKSPDGKWIAFSKGHNLFIKSTETNKEHQLSFDGEKNYEYASFYGWYDKMEGENGARPKNFRVDWSEDSKWIATNVVDLREAEKMYLLDWSVDSLYKPKLLSYYRGSPGDTTMVHIKPVFFNVEQKQEVKTELPKNTHINNVSVQWTEDSGVLLANYSERGYQKEFVKRIDLNTDTEQVLIVDESKTNVDNFDFKLLKKLEVIIFLSERSGWRQLYKLDLKTNKIAPITKGDYYIHNVKYTNEKTGDIYFVASGKEVNNNPYHQQLYKTNLKGEVKLITSENTHHNVSFSEDGKYFVDTYSTISIPTKTVLRESKFGKILFKLTTANVDDALLKGWKAPEVFELLAKDGETKIYGAIWKPTNFDASKTYPIIDHTYTGPHTQMFPKSFDRGFMNQSLAELGFVVMMVDGLGTFGRSKKFHNHSYKNMGNNLEDHVLAIKYLGEKYSWIDTDKVGVFGHSAGGYDTGRAMLAFPDFYKVGVASSADHDFRMEKAWWPEMYQGWPIDATYQNISNVTNAKNLKGKLLLVHGGIDDNVNPSATFKLAEAFVKADKEFDLLILPSQRHGYQGKARSYFIKKRWNYFVEHLLGTKPIWDFNWE